MAAILFDDIFTGFSLAIQKAQAAIDAQQYETFKELLTTEENTEDDQGNRTRAIKSRTVLLRRRTLFSAGYKGFMGVPNTSFGGQNRSFCR
jgi:hypothetical protein